MKVGTVFFWDKIQLDSENNPKGRWFIYLGKTVYGIKPELCHIGTTTTQLRYYEAGGYRANRLFMIFNAGEFGFDAKCILDVDDDIHSECSSKIDNNPDIGIMGQIDSERLEKLFALIRDSKGIDKMTKREIFFSFRDAGLKVQKI